MASNYRNIFYIYIDEFQPFHKKNKDFFETIKIKNPTRSFINLIGFELNEELPFSLEETEKLLAFFDINFTNVIYTNKKHDIAEIKEQFNIKKIDFDEKRDAIIFIESLEDYDVRISSDQEEYLNSYEKNKSNIQPANKHSYVIYAGSDSIKENDKKLNSLSDIKTYFNSLSSDEQKKKFILDMYPDATDQIYNMIHDELSGISYVDHPTSDESVPEEDEEVNNEPAEMDIDSEKTEPEQSTDLPEKPKNSSEKSNDELLVEPVKSDEEEKEKTEDGDEDDEFKKKIKEMVNNYIKDNESSIFNLMMDPVKFKKNVNKNIETFKKSKKEI